MNNKITIRFGVLAGIVLLAAMSRLIPHPFNFAPIGAMALFGAAYFSNRFIAYAVPILSMWLSSIVINNTIYASYYDYVWLYPEGFPWVWFAVLLITSAGFFLLRKVKITSVVGGSLTASVLFFLVSNFGVWLGSAMYPQNAAGLITCYVAGIPFFWNTLAGDLFYSAVLFGTFELAKYRFSVLAKVKF